MGITRRLVIIIWLGVIPLIMGIFLDAHMSFYIIYNSLVLIMYLVDLQISPSSKNIEVERFHEDTLQIGIENSISLRIRNTSNNTVHIRLKDSVPQGFLVDSPIISVCITAMGVIEESYMVTPHKRGDYRFGDIHGRLTGVLGLCSKQLKINCSEDISVYPDLYSMKKYRLLAMKQNLLKMGGRTNRGLEMATTFSDLREYTTDDEYRKINWKATARVGKLITNIYDAEQSQNVFIVIDIGRTMLSSIEGMNRLDYSVNAALVLAQLAIDRGDKVGLVIFGKEIDSFIKPSDGKTQMKIIMDVLYGIQPHHYESDIEEFAKGFGLCQRKRSFVCLFSHIVDEESSRNIVRALSGLNRRHMLMVISLLNPGLKRLINRPTINIEGVYSKASALHHINAENNAGHILTRMGIPAVIAEPGELTHEVINKYIDLKMQMRI